MRRVWVTLDQFATYIVPAASAVQSDLCTVLNPTPRPLRVDIRNADDRCHAIFDVQDALETGAYG